MEAIGLGELVDEDGTLRSPRDPAPLWDDEEERDSGPSYMDNTEKVHFKNSDNFLA
ncbi:unnamed protein product [Protopolystoma xenopodis]|uniref:Uncharacterized protein n=1 Tax=Protopolystoma xenopodis TaxID=117903 RepID=A0A3S5A580_9PLAT|nr:unnamed protein product [Protopolystoma xenopodis]